jgi:hypothetical protein
MEQVLCEPVELTESELDAVAGGNPFSSNAFSIATTNNSGSFAIGAVLGDFSTASGIFAGVVNIFDIDVHPTTSIVVTTSVNIGIGL